MNRRNFLSLTGTFTGSLLVVPDFLHAFGNQSNIVVGEKCIVFIQLDGGNDGLNTFVPFDNPLYYDLRPKVGLSKDIVIGKNNGMAFHPALKDFANMQQKGHLSVIQNVGYPEPSRANFIIKKIWQTASSSAQYLSNGWIGRYLDIHFKEHHPTAAINIDTIDNLSLKGIEPNFITIKNPNQFKTNKTVEKDTQLSENPQLDFVKKIANSITEGADDIQKALKNATTSVSFPKTKLGRNLEWMAQLIKGNLNSKVYYTSLNGFDTHDNQLAVHQNKLAELNDAVYSFYTEMVQSNLLQNVTLVVFSEFGRRVKDNGNGTDHGTAAPMFVIGGNNKGKIIGNNPNLSDLDAGDLKYEIDFRSVYASLLENQLDFDPKKIGTAQSKLMDLF